MKLISFALLALIAPVSLLAANAAGTVKLTKLDDRVRVEIDGQLFTEYVFKGASRRYRFYFHGGDEKAAKVAERYADYAAGK